MNFNIGPTIRYPFEALIWSEKAGMKNMVSTKIEFSFNKISRIQDLSDLARLLFPGNRNHQKVFLVIFIELKYAECQFLSSLTPLCKKHDFSCRMIETVRAKMRRRGLIDHVSRFNKKYGYQEGWVFSKRFTKATNLLGNHFPSFTNLMKDKETLERGLIEYL